MNGIDGTATAIAAGGGHSCAIQTGTGAVVCWGDDTYGQATPPASVNGTSGAATAIAASTHDCAIQAGTGAVVCWGNDSLGQATPPPSVDGTTGTATAIAVGSLHSCAVQADSGAVVCWGWDDVGQATPPPSVNGADGAATAIAAGSSHSCAIQAGTNAVVCWGSNYGRPFVPGSPDNRYVGQAAPPPSVNGLAGAATAISLKNEHSCAVQAGAGIVVCWGDDFFGQATPPASVNGTTGSASAIATGDRHSCAIQTGTGIVVCWGNDAYGQATPPASVSGTTGRATAIAVASDHSVAIQAAGCSDGLDTDGDSLIDYPADPGCESPRDVLERDRALVCDDGLDNDGDRDADYPEDPGCTSSSDASERGAAFACDDGIDNDGDGLSDEPSDPGCDFSSDETEIGPGLICDDGIDNDADGSVDYPADRNCVSSTDRSESPQPCDDGIDNDGDGLVDYPADPSCLHANDLSEDLWVLEEVQRFPSSTSYYLPLHLHTARLTVGSDGNVYGTALGAGTLFRIDAAGVPATLHIFANDETSRLVVGQDGALYGTTCAGCGAYSVGLRSDVFRIDDMGNVSTLLQLPTSAASDLLLGSDGALYGALSYDDCTFGDCQLGNLFKVSLPGTLTILTGRVAGAVPSVVGSDGAVYGTRLDGNDGSLFRLSTRGSFSTIDSHGYTGVSTLALGQDGLIYGADARGNQLFRIDDAGSFDSLHVFSYGDGWLPLSPLTKGGDGALYGVTALGGGFGQGTVFRVDTSGTFSTVAHLGNEPIEWRPNQPFGSARDGTLWATAGLDRLLKIDNAGRLGFVRFAPGLEPQPYHAPPFGDALVEGADCALYGGYHDYADASIVVFRLFAPGNLCHAITFDPLPDRGVGDPPFRVAATCTSALPVSFTASGACTVGGDEVTLTNGGLCTVTASQAGDARYGPAPEVSQSFRVLFDFGGFLHPIESAPALNLAAAGRTVPIRFALGADAGRDVLAEGSPAVRAVSCETLEALGDFEPAVGLGSHALVHRPGGERYLFRWKTRRDWAGSCRELAFEFIDGTTQRAYFRLPRR